jgi:hypothetical protein
MAIFGPALDLGPYSTQLEQIWGLLDQAAQEPPLVPPRLAPEVDREQIKSEDLDPNPWYVAPGPIRDELLERVFELSYAILTSLSPIGHCYRHCPLVYFIGVLGIHSQNLAYHTAYAFTPTLAGLLWVSRLLLVEYTLPLAPYRHLDLLAQSWISDHVSRLQGVRRRFLCRGGSHTISYLIDLLSIGRTIARKEGARSNIGWARDGQSLTLFQPLQWQRHQDGDRNLDMALQPITLAGFREMVTSAIRHCHRLTEELMFGWQPVIDLEAIVDNIADRHVGYSYIQEPANNLRHAYRELLRRAWAGELQAKDRWSYRHCHHYLRQFEKLQLQLLARSHFTSGTPGRGTEVNTVKWQNTAQVLRNIYFYRGRVLLIFEYNKTPEITQKSFYIVRILPVSISRLWFLYLTYLRPFVDCLRHSLGQQPGQETHLGPPARPAQQAYAFLNTSNQVYNTSHEIRRLSLCSCSRPLTVASYRQVVAAIAKRYVKELLTAATATAGDAAFESLAHQFGHEPEVLDHNYGLDRSYPAKLQPELIAKYKQVSACWHQWLQLADFERQLLRPTRAAAVAVAVAEEPATVTGRPLSPKRRRHGEIRQFAVFEIMEWANRLAWRLGRGLGEISETKVLMPFCRMLLIALLASTSHKGPCRKVMFLGKTRTIMSVAGTDEPFGYADDLLESLRSESYENQYKLSESP